jgi:hypothetical protein
MARCNGSASVDFGHRRTGDQVGRGLTRAYRGRVAVNGIDLTVLPSQVYGFLGPYGAGKRVDPAWEWQTVRPAVGHNRRWQSHLARRTGLMAR